MDDLKLHRSPEKSNLDLGEVTTEEIEILQKLVRGKFVLMVSVIKSNGKSHFDHRIIIENYILEIIQTKRIYQLYQTNIKGSSLLLIQDFKNYLSEF